MAREYRPRRVRDEEERGQFSGGYIQLEEGERFLGYALFDGNPAEDEPGYYEFFDHWIQSAKRSFPCLDEDCPWCEEGERPRNRAKSAWFVVEDNKGNEINKVMTFNLNGKIIRQFTELRKEDEKVKGRLFRVALTSDRGDYTLLPKQDVLKVADVKEHLKAVPDFEADLVAQAKKAMEAIAVSRALDEDDEPEPDDEPDEKPKTSSKGKGKPAPEPVPEADWPDEADDLEVVVAKVDDDNTIVVESNEYDDQTIIWGTVDLDLTEIGEGTVITVSYETDNEGDKVALSFEESTEPEPEEEDEAGSDLPDKIEDVIFEVVKVNDSEWSIDVKNEDMETTIYILDTMEIDFDDYKVGTKIKVSADKDTQGDLVVTEVPEIQKATRAKSGGARKTTTTRRKTAAAGKGK